MKHRLQFGLPSAVPDAAAAWGARWIFPNGQPHDRQIRDYYGVEGVHWGVEQEHA